MYDYQQVIDALRDAYSHESAEQRDNTEKEDWKVVERQKFLSLLQKEGKTTLSKSTWHFQSMILRRKG